MKINRTILIVEDEEKLRTTVSDFLKLYDYNIIEAIYYNYPYSISYIVS